jgi:hypothetical protein
LTHESIDTRNLEAKSISSGAQYATSDSKLYCGKVKMCQFSPGKWFFCTKFVQLAVAGYCAPPKISDKLDLTASQYF